ncbi:MAG TPA: metallophosphoesterase family protein [Longimicrobium sp.]|nr:metallophosphoesterase family protein [Longimicrobium sp.]
MMRAAAIYDIHGNLPALEAVLAEIRLAAPDVLVCGGDVLPGPMPRECMELLLGLELPVRFIRGNGDRFVLETMRGEVMEGLLEPVREVMRWNGEQITPEQERVIDGWPSTLHLSIGGVGSVLFCHATPRSDTEIFTRLTPEQRLVPIFGEAGAEVVVCGHTHMQFDRMIGRKRVVNAGSVGMPFGRPDACWLMLGPGVELKQTRYAFNAAADQVRQTRYPDAEHFARHLLHPPTEEEMLKAYAARE